MKAVSFFLMMVTAIIAFGYLVYIKNNELDHASLSTIKRPSYESTDDSTTEIELNLESEVKFNNHREVLSNDNEENNVINELSQSIDEKNSSIELLTEGYSNDITNNELRQKLSVELQNSEGYKADVLKKFKLERGLSITENEQL